MPKDKMNEDGEPILRGSDRHEKAKQENAAASAPAAPAPVAPAAPTGPNAATYGAGYDADTAAAMQGGPAATMARANEAAREQAKMQADLATRNAIQAGRSAGMMPGQAALGAQSQAANAYGVGMGQGQQQFAGYTQLGGQLGAEMAQRGLTEKGIEVQKYSAEQQARAAQRQANQGLFSSLFGAAGGIAALFSDRRLKEDTVPARIASSLDKINSYTYKYKGNSRPEAGVMAQDLEKTAMAPAVIETPRGKAVDTNRLSTMNTAALSEHEKRLKDIERMIRDMGGINA